MAAPTAAVIACLRHSANGIVRVHATTSLPPARPTDTIAAAFGPTAEAAVRRSWSRATGLYGLDPGLRGDRHVLSSQRLRDHVDPLEAFLRVAHAGMAQLHAQLHAAGYVMLLADPAGVAVAFLSNAAFELEVGKAHLGVGTRYAEADEGTCGIGTCLAERAPMTIHKAEHYLRRNIGLTCTAAPIFAPGGNLLSVLCASSVSA
ncbi:MAG TPA: GAF domain-containing protein, partial [Burkholderiaceae bacterium]